MTNEEQVWKISEDWREANRERFNALRREPGLVLRPGEVAALLAHTAQNLATTVCPGGSDCVNCNDHRLLWWDLCNSLPRETATSLQSFLKSAGVDLPDSAWENE